MALGIFLEGVDNGKKYLCCGYAKDYKVLLKQLNINSVLRYKLISVKEGVIEALSKSSPDILYNYIQPIIESEDVLHSN